MADVLTLAEVQKIYHDGDWSVPEKDSPNAEVVSGRRRRKLYILAEDFQDFGIAELHDECMALAAKHNELFPAKWAVGKSRIHNAWHSGKPYLVIFHEKHGDDINLANTPVGIAGIYLRRLHQMLDDGWFDTEKPDVPDPQLDLLKPAQKVETRSEEEIVRDVLRQACESPELMIPCGRWAAGKIHDRDGCEYGRVTVEELTPAGPYQGDPWK